MRKLNTKKTLTFCLFFFFSFSQAYSKPKTFKSRHLNTFYKKAVKVQTTKLNGVEYCKLYHKGLELKKESQRTLAIYNVPTLGGIAEEDIKKILLKSENKDLKFWKDNKVKMDPKKLSTIEEIVKSNVFNNLSGVIDNIYCFPYLGARYEKDAKRKVVTQSLSGIQKSVKAFIYYDDGFYSKTSSVLIVYLLDPKKNEVYALKGIIK